ncbi:MAG: amino acid ABC transporter substrate-binding protein [Desulfobacteraceae bacterium]|nr:amino acid ABC transporter substrate-binding protein [Desulfobacteraceae bacterium]
MKSSLIVISFILITAVSSVADNNEIKVRVTDYVPQYYQDENGEWKGMGVELAQVLIHEAGCKPVFLKLPWKRALRQMAIGEVDMMLNLSITEERKNYMHFVGPQRDESMVLIVKKGICFLIDSFEDFKQMPKRVAIENGGYYGEAFKEKYETDPAFADKISIVVHTQQYIKMLTAGRITAFIGDRYNMAYKIKTQPSYKDCKILPFIVNQDFVYFGLSKKSVSKEKLERIQKAYERAKAKGKFEEILKQYQ